mmetsp:Transcript_5426/g.11189  ORF Transcript_5426/g.11189 Transcript_5426/m.11189 type:complete len:497 (-) Transcript_5426:26-1516(-)
MQSDIKSAKIHSTASIALVKIDEAISFLNSILLTLSSNTFTFPSDPEILCAAFDPNLNRRNLGSAPSRRVTFLPTPDAIFKISSVISDLRIVCRLLLPNSENALRLSRLRRSFESISLSNPHVLTRSLIVLCLYFDGLLLGSHDLSSYIAAAMNSHGIPQSITSSSIIQPFLIRLGKPLYDSLKMLMAGRARQRSIIDPYLFSEWASLQGEADAIDRSLSTESGQDVTSQQFIFGFVTAHTMWIVGHYIMLGLELKIFCGKDVSYAYECCDYYLSEQLRILSQMRCLKEKSRAHNVVTNLPNLSEEEAEETLEYFYLHLQRNLCRATVLFVSALKYTKVIFSPNYEFTSTEAQFQKRFEGLNAIIYPPTRDYAAVMALNHICEDNGATETEEEAALAAAHQAWGECRAYVDSLLEYLPGDTKERKDDHSGSWLPVDRNEVMKLKKICVGNAVYVHKLMLHSKSLLKESHPDSSYFSKPPIVKFEFQHHDHFCSITL